VIPSALGVPSERTGERATSWSAEGGTKLPSASGELDVCSAPSGSWGVGADIEGAVVGKLRGRILSSTVLVALAAVSGVVPAGAAGTRDCTDRPLEPGADLRRCDLRPLQLATLDLNGADMRRATLAGMTLGGGADGPRTNFRDVRLDRADLRGVPFGDLDLTGASLTRADLRRTGWEDTTAMNADLSRADLRGASLSFGGIAGANFQRADLRGARLRSTYGAYAGLQTDFRRADLSGADISNASLAAARFERADLTRADLTDTDLTGARFARATLTEVTWSNTTCPDGTNSDANGGTCLGHL
jgi:uncharacterized protein YjbI with pentapeptide repeats